ncbi:MAG TPA: GAF domain-containing protein, partial [Flavisolibacter sp.]|nr:GAF domain-containing protein [Flavisolibacter sp.]
SSTERSQSIQQDLLEQLNMVKEILEKAIKVIEFPLLKETIFRINKYIAAVSDTLLSDDEILIYDFLQDEVDSMFKNLRHSKPELKKWIDEYFAALDPQRKVIYHHRKDYEESITRINDVLDRFIDNEQQEAQEIYPHYFERYITDGVECNIYVGQSLSPQQPFNEMYVRNLKLWQLSLLVKAARISHTLEKRLALPLQTTQLILAHSIPLSISFRRKERKFDVDGAYNIRYEIVKKRIDKVHLKDSEERLTQPGKIAIVYSQHRELEEYLEFIEYLQSEQLLGDQVEHLELEDTQGISGLKAVRVNVVYPAEGSGSQKIELSRTTSSQLLKK